MVGDQLAIAEGPSPVEVGTHQHRPAGHRRVHRVGPRATRRTPLRRVGRHARTSMPGRENYTEFELIT